MRKKFYDFLTYSHLSWTLQAGAQHLLQDKYKDPQLQQNRRSICTVQHQLISSIQNVLRCKIWYAYWFSYVPYLHILFLFALLIPKEFLKFKPFEWKEQNTDAESLSKYSGEVLNLSSITEMTNINQMLSLNEWVTCVTTCFVTYSCIVFLWWPT